MRTKAEIISLLTNPGIIAVVRAQKAEQVLPLSEALIAGGVIAIEITMTTPNAIAAIREASGRLGSRALIGVGTVLDGDTCRAALAAGAEFVVSPVCRPEFVPIASAAQRPVMLGAYTPTEAQLGARSGRGFHQDFSRGRSGAGLHQGDSRAAAAFAHRADGRRGGAERRRFFQRRLCRGRRGVFARFGKNSAGRRLARIDATGAANS